MFTVDVKQQYNNNNKLTHQSLEYCKIDFFNLNKNLCDLIPAKATLLSVDFLGFFLNKVPLFDCLLLHFMFLVIYKLVWRLSYMQQPNSRPEEFLFCRL